MEIIFCLECPSDIKYAHDNKSTTEVRRYVWRKYATVVRWAPFY